MDIYIKQNNSQFKDQLICEAKGLQALRELSPEIKIPKVLAVDESRMKLEKIHSQSFSERGFKILGRGLAKLHRLGGEYFGLKQNNYIGLNPQNNSPSSNWGKFFLQQRLMYQVELIKNSGIKEELLEILNHKAEEIIDFLNDHSPSPSPVHGDLWRGNALWDGQNAWLIDPAFYFGDREVDIAMTAMFGGFSEEFYKEYQKETPLPEGYRRRAVIYNLYHYLNHYNLFGSSYLSGARLGFKHIEGI